MALVFVLFHFSLFSLFANEIYIYTKCACTSVIIDRVYCILTNFYLSYFSVFEIQRNKGKLKIKQKNKTKLELKDNQTNEQDIIH